MSIKAITFQQFEGGQSTDLKTGIKHSQAYVQSFDFRKSPSQISVLPGLAREDKNIMKDLVLNEIMAVNGIIYAFGDAGYLYKRTSAGVWSTEGKLSSGSGGMDYRIDNDSIYLTSDKSVSLYNPLVNGSPVLTPDKYATSYSTYNNTANTGFNVNAYQTGSLLSTAIQLATSPLNEASGNIRYFQTDIEPLQRISVFINSKGTGDWTLTLHDGLNNVLGTSTVTNANLKNGGWNDFVFTSAPNGQVRVYPAPNARTYHIHVTSTVADGTVASTSVNDLSTIDLQIWADRLIKTNNGLHPMTRFLQYEVIGNGNYLSVWEPLSETPTNDEWKRQRLTFPQEYEVCGLDKQNEFLVIACEKTTTTGATPQEGILFFWDGLSDQYNYFMQIPEGSPQSLHCYKNVIYYYAGGSWYATTSVATQPIKLRSMPGIDTEFSGTNSTINCYPRSATVRRGIHLMAYPGYTTNTSVNFGVYSWGSPDKNFPESFGYSYALSTGSRNYSVSNNLKIGTVQSFGDLLHVSWRDDTSGGYGIDYVDNTSKPAPTAVWESLIYDGGYVARDKQANYMDVYYTSLPAGSSIRMKYKIDRGDWIYDTVTYTSTNLWQGKPNYIKFNTNDSNARGGRFREIQLGIEVTCDSTVTTPPVISMVSLVFDDLKQEALS